MDTRQFPNWKRGIFHRGKEIKDLSGGVQVYAAQTRPQNDAAIAKKDRFRAETN